MKTLVVAAISLILATGKPNDYNLFFRQKHKNCKVVSLEKQQHNNWAQNVMGEKKMWWVQYQESGPSSMRQSLFGNISTTSFRNPCYSLSLKCATQAPVFNTNPDSNHWHTLPPWTKPLHQAKPLNGEWKETFPRLLLSKQHKVTNATSKVSKTSPLVCKGHLSTTSYKHFKTSH